MKKIFLLILLSMSLLLLACQKKSLLSAEKREAALEEISISIQDASLDKATSVWSGYLNLTNKSDCTFVDCSITFNNYLLTADGWTLSLSPFETSPNTKLFSLNPGETVSYFLEFPQSEYESWEEWMSADNTVFKIPSVALQGYFESSKEDIYRFQFTEHLLENGDGTLAEWIEAQSDE